MGSSYISQLLGLLLQLDRGHWAPREAPGAVGAAFGNSERSRRYVLVSLCKLYVKAVLQLALRNPSSVLSSAVTSDSAVV